MSHDIEPSIIWKLFTVYWRLFVPHIIITTIETFSLHDDHWEKVTKNSWIFTNGFSPLCTFRTEACVIAIQKAKDFYNWKSLFAAHKKVRWFPCFSKCSTFCCFNIINIHFTKQNATTESENDKTKYFDTIKDNLRKHSGFNQCVGAGAEQP